MNPRKYCHLVPKISYGSLFVYEKTCQFGNPILSGTPRPYLIILNLQFSCAAWSFETFDTSSGVPMYVGNLAKLWYVGLSPNFCFRFITFINTYT